MSKQIKLCRIKDITSRYECRYCLTPNCGKTPCTNQIMNALIEKKKSKKKIIVDNRKLTAKTKELAKELSLTSQRKRV